MNIDYTVWATIALMHIVAVVSPGPDFAVVLKQSLQKGLRPALWTSLGIGSGILLHVMYSILGVSLLISTTPWLYNTLLYLAAAYFLWIGVSALRSKPSVVEEVNQTGQDIASSENAESRWYTAFGLGFLTNGLNPKATLFFLALFTGYIPVQTSLETKVFYGFYFAITTAVWFCFLSFLTNYPKIRYAYRSHGYWFDRLMGVVLIAMAIMLLLT
jgi:threonine/homoserine/homoserine lactone efflux protein